MIPIQTTRRGSEVKSGGAGGFQISSNSSSRVGAGGSAAGADTWTAVTEVISLFLAFLSRIGCPKKFFLFWTFLHFKPTRANENRIKLNVVLNSFSVICHLFVN